MQFALKSSLSILQSIVDCKAHSSMVFRKMCFRSGKCYLYTVMDIKDWTLHRAIEVKVP